MPIQTGARIGPYEVAAPLGAGGMGEVYEATDSRLKRRVAIKVLPDEVARDPDRLARFEREAQVLASLNHPNIGAIYGVEEAGSVRCLVLELVEGQTLAARIDAGAIPEREALGFALQIAEGLEAAHEKGIVHRDLKPANVMVGSDGKIKILDFGLAKALEGDLSGSAPEVSLSPTMTAAATRAGVILGTAGYMSPEQARGKGADRRSDVWAFGVILYEMLVGKRIFTGETVSDTLAAVLRAEVEWGAIPGVTPGPVRWLLRRCLERDVRLRLRDIGEARILLSDVIAGRPTEIGAAAPAPVTRRGWSPLLAAGLALGAALAAGFAAWSLKPAPSPHVRKFEVQVASLENGPAFAVSPDGLSIVYAGDDRLWLRRLDKLEARPIQGTEGAADPFWSTDSQWIGYFAAGKLRKVALAGGESSVICTLPEPLTRGVGASWSSGDSILLAMGSGAIYQVPARGGDARVLVSADDKLGDDHFHEPSWLPGQSAFLFTVHRKSSEGGVDTLALSAGGKRKVLLQLKGQEIWRPAYSSTGHILYRRQPDNSGIWALPFSLSRLEVSGEPFLVAPDGNFPSVSGEGTLVYVQGGSSGPQQLVWVDRKGEVVGTIGQPQPDIIFTSLSPDGGRIAVASHEGDNWDIWTHDVTRGTKTRLTFEKGSDFDPSWTPSGDRVIYQEEGAVWIRPADGTGQPRNLVPGTGGAVSPDGKWLIYEGRDEKGRTDLWLKPLDSDAAPRPFLQSPAVESAPRISPDGLYVAYMSDESGTTEVYLKRFPSGEGKWQVSVRGGVRPIWSRKGDEIIYRNEDTLVSVPVKTTPALQLGTPVELFDAIKKGLSVRPRSYDISPDGKRLLVIKPVDGATQRKAILVTTHWLSEFTPSNSP
jgi:eukaryotic-like serine/threonine-protein kinase